MGERTLLERLRGFEYLSLEHICCEAADRIEELELQLEVTNNAFASAHELIRELEAQLAESQELHRRNANVLDHKWKHQDKGHQCGWKVLCESMIQRSKAILEKQK